MASGPTPSFHLVWAFMTLDLKSNPGAVEEKVSLRQVHRNCVAAGASDPTMAQRWACRACEQIVPPEEICYGYEFEKSRWLTMDKEEVSRLYQNTRNLLRSVHLQVLTHEELPQKEKLQMLFLKTLQSLQEF